MCTIVKLYILVCIEIVRSRNDEELNMTMMNVRWDDDDDNGNLDVSVLSPYRLRLWLCWFLIFFSTISNFAFF